MEIIQYILLSVGLLYFIWRLIPTKGITQITTSTLKEELHDQSKQFIDVRTPGEFHQEKIKGFKNIPLNVLADKLDSIDKNRPVV